jgi:acetylornithine deacetylase/succinyl-diaminopimelate desuccinylase-like protein
VDILEFLRRFIAIRSVSSDPSRAGEMARAAEFLAQFLSGRGFAAEVNASSHCPPIVLATRGTGDAPLSLLIYAHYDVQPADPLPLWDSDPYTLLQRDGKLFGRGIADNKGPLAAILFALEELAPSAPLRLTLLLEGGEEIGSPGLAKFLQAHRSQLRADAVLVADCSSGGEDSPALTTALRGLISFQVHLRTGQRELHSGWGGCVPNAIQELLQLCGKLHDASGRVSVAGFYDGCIPPTAAELDALDGKLHRNAADALGVRALRDPFPPLPPAAAHACLPSLEFNGIHGGCGGAGVKTIIPAEAEVKFTTRLVHGQHPEKIRRSLVEFLRSHAPAYADLHIQAESHCPAYGVDLESASLKFRNLFHAAEWALAEAFSSPPLHLRDGGSIGAVSAFKEVLGLDSILLGIVPPAAQVHAPNENWSLDNLRRARQALSLFLGRAAQSIA